MPTRLQVATDRANSLVSARHVVTEGAGRPAQAERERTRSFSGVAPSPSSSRSLRSR